MFSNKMIVNWLAASGVATATAFASGCGGHTASAASLNDVAIAVAPAAVPGDSAAYDATGSVVARHVYKLGFEIPGRVSAVHVEVGDRVTAGTVLARLDDADYSAQLQAADGQAASTQALMSKTMRGARTQERASAAASVAAAQGQLERALAAAALARSNAARVRQLFAQGAVSAQQADAAAAAQRDGDAAVDAARAQLAAATQQASLVDAGPRSEDRAAAQAQWQAAAATAQLALVTLAKTELVAPANAIVQRRDIEPGDLAQPGSEAFVLEDSGIPDVVVSVPERYAGQIHIGDHATITYRGSTYRAAIYRVEPAADAVTRTLEVRVRGARLPLPLGGIVEVALGEASSRGASIPLGALIVDASTGRRVVEIYDASHHTVAMRDVRLISTQGDAAIVAGLQAGEPIVVAGEYEAKPGVAVHVVGEGTNR